VAKETDADTDKLADSVRKAVSEKSYSICVVIPKDHIQASILLNRDKGINAAICSSDNDMRAAKENNANVIIIKQEEATSATAMLAGLFAPYSNGSDAQKARAAPASPEKQPVSQAAKPSPKQEGASNIKPSGSRDSMLKKLKYSLGIEE